MTITLAHRSHPQGGNTGSGVERLTLESDARVAQDNSKDTSVNTLDLADEHSRHDSAADYQDIEDLMWRPPEDKDSNNLPAPGCLHPLKTLLHSSRVTATERQVQVKTECVPPTEPEGPECW